MGTGVTGSLRCPSSCLKLTCYFSQTNCNTIKICGKMYKSFDSTQGGTALNTQEITKYLDSLEEKGIPSVDMIVMKDHEVVYRHMNGFTDEEKKLPVREDQRYLMFSMTKVQTMTALMQLVEQGKISLEDEVGRYLPSYNDIQIKQSDGTIAPAKTKLLVKHLVSMQSGLDYDLERGGIKRVLAEKGDKAATREIVDSFVEAPFNFEPGTHFNYSLSHDVVAAIIEVVSGVSFGKYLKKNIWEPLGMNNTFFAQPMNDDVERLADQYIVNPEGKIVKMEKSCNYQLSASYESGGAGLISCTEDYAKLADSIASGGVNKDGVRILKPETIDIIKTNLLGPDSLKDIRETMGRKGYGYGVGMQIFMNPDEVNSPAPSGIFGWDGAAGSCIQMDTVSGVSFVYTMHVRNFGYCYDVIHPHLRDLVFG